MIESEGEEERERDRGEGREAKKCMRGVLRLAESGLGFGRRMEGVEEVEEVEG